MSNNRTLEQELKNDLVNAYKEGKKFGYKAIEMLDALTEDNFIGKLITFVSYDDNHLPNGFVKLYEAGRLDLSIENIIVQDKYKSLFINNYDIIKTCKERLERFGVCK